jgi:hypothetical protein
VFSFFWNRLVRDVFARDTIDELNFHIAKGSLESDSITTVRSRRQAHDKDFLKLAMSVGYLKKSRGLTPKVLL